MSGDVQVRELELAGRRVLILGLARQGTALARFLAQAGAEVTVSDLRGETTLADRLAELEGLPIRYVLGEHPFSLLDRADLLCLSGGVPVDAPIVAEARRRSIPLSNDAQLFLERCPAPVIGITGSAGKTTTTALVGEMCRVAGLRIWVGGNIGNPLIADLDRIGPTDWVVMELSSFQLEVMTASPHVAAVLNVTPNHLDRHKTMEAYVAAKRNIVAHQRPEDFALLGYGDANARSLALETAAHLLWFSVGAEVDEGAFKTNGELTLRLSDGAGPWQGDVDRVICQASEVRLRGRHNLLNVLAACVLAGIAGVPVEAMRQVATTFTGVEHRLELVREWNGVGWYDDSIATAPERSLAALRSFEEPIVLLAGGRDKNLPWEEFADEAVQRVRRLVTFGEAGPMIAEIVEARLARGQEAGGRRQEAGGRRQEAGGRRQEAGSRKQEAGGGRQEAGGRKQEAGGGRQEAGGREREAGGRRQEVALDGITRVETLEEAVEVAARLARPGDVVLLSPGGTSFDAFRDFAHRGDWFKELVQQLPGID